MHHSWLHIHVNSASQEMKSHDPPSKEPTKALTACTSQAGISSQIWLMACQVLTIGPNGSTYCARALLHSASSTSFVMEHLAQRLPMVQ